MTLDDGVFGGGDQSATDETAQRLMEQYQPADGQAFSSDPVELTQRLLRKMNQPSETPKLKGVDFDKATKPEKPEAKKAPDLSSFGEPAPDSSSEDLSSFGDPVKEPEPPKPGVLATLGNEGTALGKGLVRGAPEAVGSMMQGGAALSKQKPESPESLGLINELQNSGAMTAGERAKLMGRALRTVGDRGLQMDFNAALQRIARGGDPNKEATDIRSKYGLIQDKAATPVEDTPLYKAGKATKDWIDKTVPMTEQEQASVGGQVGTGISSMAPYLAAGIVAGPEVGLVLGAAGMGAQTAGDTFQAAKKAGASDEKAVTAAGWGGAVGAALGTLPLGAVFKPVSAASDTWKAWFAAKLVQGGQSGVTFATVGEAQQYLLQQIAKEQYDPKAGYSPDAKRVISSLLTGSVLGTIHPLTPKPSDLSSPDAIADFLKKAAKAAGRRTPEEERGAQTRSEIDDFIRAKDAREAAAAPGLPKPEGGEPQAPSGTPPEPPSSPTGGEPTPPTEKTETEGLKRYGWSDDEIAAMSPAQRRAEFQSAMAEGQSTPPAPAEQPSTPLNSNERGPTSKSDVPATFTTAKGSTYEVHEDGTTTRNKAARSDVGHEGDSGPKERSAKTVYFDKGAINGLSIPQDTRWRVIDHGNDTMSLATWNEKAKDWGISPSARNIPFSTTPEIGKHPVELWKPETVKGKTAYKGMHAGNAITAIGATSPPHGEENPTPGTRAAPIKPETGADVFHAQAAEPTPAQAGAENYRHSHMAIEHLGLVGKNSISIETGAGQKRSSVDADGTVHENVLPFPYGRIKGTKGADGEPLDITIGPNPKSPHVFVIDQHHNDGSGFDEHKIMAGFDTPQEAIVAYGAAYDDLGGNRIGHVTAMTPDEFKTWREGDTTQPLKKHLSADEIGGIFDELVGEDQKSGEPGKPNGGVQDQGSPQLPHAQPDGGPKPARAGAVSEASGEEGEIITPGKVYAEPTEQHHAQIEAVLGADYHRVLPVDVARAAEILAEKPGITPQLAFQYAVIENAAAQNFLTRPQLEQVYGPQVKALLVSGGEGASVGGEPVDKGGTTTDQEPTSGGEEGGKLPRGGKNGTPERGEDTTVENGEQSGTRRKQPNSRRKAGDNAAEEGRVREQGAEDTGNAEPAEVAGTKIGFGPVEQYKAIHAEADRRYPPTKETKTTGKGKKAKTETTSYISSEHSAFTNGAQGYAWNLAMPIHIKESEVAGAYDAGRDWAISKDLLESDFKEQFPNRLGRYEQPKTRLDESVARGRAAADKINARETAREEKAFSRFLLTAFISRLKTDGFRNILDARRVGREHGIRDLKQVEETLELAAVKAAREIVEASKDPYPELVALYGKQPKLGTRTSTSVRDQAYSTPVPLAYVADRLAGITKDTTVLEPTAGNGALLLTADPAKVTANEINPDRADNLTSQGFRVSSRDASEGKLRHKGYPVDAVIANPPFGAVREANGESKVFDMSDIQPGYKTTEIDHAIALRALDAMKDDGRAVLILGGLNKQLQTPEKRSDGYNGKSKREFYKTLYDNYGVTDHFTVAGELYERQGAGWPVDVIVINGRGKSARALPAVDVPRIYDSWDALGGLLDGQEAGENDGAAVRPDGRALEERPGLAGNGQPDRAVARRGGAGSGNGQGEPGAVRAEPVRGQPETVGAGGNGAEEQGGHLRSRPAVRSGEQPAAERPSSRLSADEIGDIFDELVPEPDTRSTAEVAKSAAKNALSAADEALSGLTELFGGGKTIGIGLNIDEDTYAKAKPLFIEAAEKFSGFKHDIRELMRRMVDHLRDALKWTTEMLRKARPYMIQFMQDVQDGTVNLLKPEAAAPTKPESKAVETAGQSVYQPKSKQPGLDTLVPVNMKQAIEDALADLENRVGPIDDFVAKELGYDKDDLEKYFGAEQVDALGLAIDNLNKGNGFIIGDQTGIGKGRVNAAILKWAMRKGRVPVFTTEKPGLYADMFRDMTDIGMEPPRILATNASLTLPLDDAGKNWIKTGDSKKHNAHMLSLTDPENFHKHYDMVFTNYSQMQTLKGEDTARRRFLSMIAPRSTYIFDESHNAGGQDEARKAKNIAADRAEFARDLVERAKGVFYSSATYAKRPGVMSLYAATDMKMAVDDIDTLGEAIAKGGIPMQQVVAAMLAKSGQYIRRERSFHGINYNTPSVDVDHDTYDQISHSLAAIQEFSVHVKEAAKEISQALKAEAKSLGHDNAVSDAGASSTTFTSKMHNIINQMLLAMKAPEAAKMAIAHIRNGEKPVLTVANTMEAFLKDYADELGINQGDPIEADFSDVLRKYLDRSRRISMRKPFSKEKAEHYVLSDADLGPLGVQAYNDAKAMIAGMDLSHLPISPIDHIKSELEKAGYEVGEITGRGLMVDYSGKQPVLRSRPGADTTTKGRNEMRRRFNLRPSKDGLHAIIINQAGSTGISMHSGEKFDDKSKRRMMIVQPEANIDTHMQLLGRVNRTGQVVLPEYDQLVANIPAEKRPAAVLAKKMASLNANTTASRTSAVTAKDVPDFINQWGDLVAAGYLNDNMEMNERLAWPVKPGEGKLKAEDAMRKLTGRIPLLPLKQQEELYAHLEEEYAALIQQMEASGTSPLEAKTMDLKARTLETSEVQGPKNKSGSPFAAPVNVEKVSVLRQGKPFKPRELMQKLADRLGEGDLAGVQDDALNMMERPFAKKADYIEKGERLAEVNRFDEYTRPLITKIEDVKEQEAERVKFNAIKDRWTSLHTLLPIGARVRLNMVDASPVAVVLDVKQTSETKNPLALGSWKVNFAVADASRQVTLPFSRLYLQGQADPESMLDVEVVHTNESAKDTLARFEVMQSGTREDRYIATGNLLAAYDWLNMKGSIINYSDAQGAVRQGIITPKDFKLGERAIKKGRIVSEPDEIKTLLDQNQTLWSKDKQVNISRADRWSDNYEIQTEKKKATGGRYYLDKELTDLAGDFYSRGGMMTATVSGKNFPAALARLQKIGAQFTVAAAAPKAQKVESPEPPPDDEPPAGGAVSSAQLQRGELAGTALTPEASKQIGEIKARLSDIVRRVAGPLAKVNFHDGLIDDPTPRGYAPEMSTGKSYGQYTLGHGLIDLALLPGEADQMASTAYHEAYHLVEDKLLDGHELALMKTETPRIRDWLKNRPGWNAEKVEGLSDFEVRSHAFQEYAGDRDTGKAGHGLHIMVRRAFDKLLDLVRQIKNALAGLGFKTYKDIFNDAYRGRFGGERFPQMGSALKAMESDVLSSAMFRRRADAVTGRLRDVMNATTAVDRIKEKVQNLNEGVRRLEDAVEARMDGELPDSKAFYQKKRLFPGKVAQEVQDFNKQHLDPLIDLLKDKGLTLDQVGDILYAQHAPERNAYIDTINPDAGGMGSGMSDEDAAAILDRYSAHDLAEISTRIDGIRDFILDTMVRGGLESRGTTDAWRDQYDHYVPLGGFEEPRDDIDDGFRESGKFHVRGREVKQAFGRGSKAENPLLNILDQAYRTVERAKKNEYLRSLYLALAGVDHEDRKGFVQFDKGKPRREIDPRTGLVRTVDDSSYRFSPNAVAYKVGGRTHYMVFDKRDIAEVLKRMHPDALNGVGQALLNMQNKLKAMWTHYSPEFLIRHFLFRYPIEGTLNSFEQGNVPRYMMDAIPGLGRASKAIFAENKGIVHPDAETAQYQRYWQEMRQAGGAMAFRQARDVDLLREHLRKKLASISGRPLASIQDKWRAGVEAMDTVTNALDNSLRLSAYAEARRQGKTPEQAAVIARDATVDFQQAGAWKNFIGLWFPFGNVAIQTGARMGSAVIRSKTMRKVFGATIAAGFMSAMFNYLIGGDDKDGIPFYDKIPEWDKHLNISILNPFMTDDKGRPIPIKIPLPYNWAFPFALGQAMATMAFSKTKGSIRKMIHMSTMAGVEAFTPFAQEGNLAAMLAPELARPLVHTYTNQNWTGYPVHLNPDFQKGPRSQSGFKNTGEGWKYSASMLNAMSGGDKKHAGAIDMFPEDLRELFDYYSGTGTQRRFLSNVATTAENAAGGKPTDYSKLPLARVFMGTDYDAADRFRRNENRRESKRPWER